MEELQTRKCPYCGKQTPVGGEYCAHCHYRINERLQSPSDNVQFFDAPQEEKDKASASAPSNTTSSNDQPLPSNNFAIAGFVLSFFVPLLGLIFGILGKKRAEDSTGRGLATAAVVISIVTLVLEFILGIVYGVALFALFNLPPVS